MPPRSCRSSVSLPPRWKDSELHGDGVEEVADKIRLTLGEMVPMRAVGRTLTVTAGMSTNRRQHGLA